PQRPSKFDRPKRFDGERKPRTAQVQREQRHQRPRDFDERPPLRAVADGEPVEELEIAEQAEAVEAAAAQERAEVETAKVDATEREADEADTDESELEDEADDEGAQQDSDRVQGRDRAEYDQDRPRTDRNGAPELPEGAVSSALDPEARM